MAFLRRYPVAAYCLITFTITWGFKYLYLIQSAGPELPVFNLKLIAQFGPFLAATLLITCVEGRTGWRKIIRSLFNFKLGMGWIILAFGFELVLFLLFTLLYGLKYGSYPVSGGFTFPQSVWGFLVTFTGGLIFWGIAEEVGWRGWMFPRLQRRMQPFTAAIISAVIVTIWHANPGAFQSEFLTFREGVYLWGYFSEMLERLCISIPITLVIVYIFNNTRGSLLLMIVFHSMSNTSYFWVGHTWGIQETVFFRSCFSVSMVIIGLVFGWLLLRQKKKIVSI